MNTETLPKTEYTCQYCEKSFRREQTLSVHVCEKKKRYQSQFETGVQIGLNAYLKFYEMSQGSAKLKTFEDFADSPYYRAFVKFGQYCVSIRAINVPRFIEWLLKNNKKIDYWCRDKIYGEFLEQYIRIEHINDALERSIREMQNYVDDHADIKNGIADYFRYGNSNRICYDISTGRISPWVVYSCDSGVAFLSALDPSQITMLWPMIDADFWTQKFKDYWADAEYAKEILKGAGL